MRRLRLVQSIEDGTAMRIKIAFASSDRRQVNQHFGAAEAFVVYELSEDGAQLIEVVEFGDAPSGIDGNENTLGDKIDLLAGCAAVYCSAVGASAVRRLLAAGIQPVKVGEGEPIDALLGGLRDSLVQQPPQWLARWLKKQRSVEAADRFDAMEVDGWQE